MCPTRTCTGCSKVVVDSIYCPNCRSYYHPSCLKLKALRPGCLACCRDTYSRSSLSNPQSAHSSTSHPAADVINTQPPLGDPAASSIVALFNDLTRRIDSRFDDLRGRLDDLDSRLSCLPVMQAQIEANSARILDLEGYNAVFAEDLRDLRATIADLQEHRAASLHDLRRTSARLCDAELVLSGAPCSSSKDIPALVSRATSALGVTLANEDVVATRFLVPRSRARRDIRDSPLPIVARFRSRELCRRIINAKKAKGILHTTDLDPQSSCPPRVIRINDLLPGDVYKLLVATRLAAKARGYKHVWHSDGSVLIKLRDGDRIRRISSPEDLQLFEAEFSLVLPDT